MDEFYVVVAFLLVLAAAGYTYMCQSLTVRYYRRELDLERAKVRRYEAMFPDYVRDAVERRVMEEVSRGE